MYVSDFWSRIRYQGDGLRKALNFSFLASLIFLLLLVFLKEFLPAFSQFSMLTPVILVAVYGVFVAFLNWEEKLQRFSPQSRYKSATAGIAGLVSAVLIWYKFKAQGPLAYLVALLAGILITLTAKFILEYETIGYLNE